jgi:hypothetical protein
MRELVTMVRIERSLDHALTDKEGSAWTADLDGVIDHVAKSLKTAPEDLTVAMAVESEPAFFDYIARRRVPPATKTQLNTDWNTLLGYARKFGISSESIAIRDKWDPIRAVLPSRGARTIAADAVRRKCFPVDFSNADLAAWGDAAAKAGSSYWYVKNARATFLRAIRKSGPDCQRMVPRLDVSVRRPTCYTLRLANMPQSLRDRIMEIVDARRVQAELGMASMKPATEAAIILAFEELCGYAVQVRGMDVADLGTLLNETFIKEFAFWLHKERKCKRTTVVHTISLIFTTLQYYPGCQGLDFSWVYGIYRKIRKEPASALKGRRRERFIEYETLARVPEQMLDERVARQRTPVAKAWRVHDELLLSFLILAQYPPWFVREARLGTNVFKKGIPKIGPFNIPSWAEELLREDSGAEFWQFRFESPQGQVFRGLILRRLIPLLELYVQLRPLLIGESMKPDPGTMFFSRGLTPLSCYSLGQRVVQLTHRYTHKRVTPTAIRSSFAYHWRAKYSPRKDAVLANIQWVQYPTIKLRYDEKFRMEQRARVNRRKNRYM